MKLTPIKSRFLFLLLSFSQYNGKGGIAIDGCIDQMSSYSSSDCLQMKNCGMV